MNSGRRLTTAATAAVIGLATSTPVAAEDPVVTGEEFETQRQIAFYTDADGLHVVGQFDRNISGHAFGRFQAPHLVLDFSDADGLPVHLESAAMMLATATPDTDVPWHVVVTADLTTATSMEVRVFSNRPRPEIFPVGGLDVSPATLAGLTATGTVENDSTTVATDLVIHATLQGPEFNGDWYDTASSAPIPTLAPGATAEYSVTFSEAAPAAPADAIVEVVAETKSGPYLTNWENHFSDIDRAGWFEDDVLVLARERLISGCAGGDFCPTRGLTRGEMATLLDRALELPDTTADYFGDDDGHWAEDSINRLAEAGISDGCATDAFCPEGRVNRGQIAKFIVLGYGVPPSSVDAFTDDETSTTEAYHDAMAAAGLANGCNAFTHRYCPSRQLSRAEMAGFLARAEGIAP